MWCCTWCDHLLVSVVCPKIDASFIAEMAVFSRGSVNLEIRLQGTSLFVSVQFLTREWPPNP